MDKYSVIDIETTGSRKYGHKITEIAIINIDADEIVEEFSTLIDPERSIPRHIQRLTNITDEMVCGKPKFYEVAKKIVTMTEGRIFVAHNVFFDYNFLQYEFSELGFQFSREKLCTVKMARKILPGHKSYSLGNICQDLSIEIKGRHRAKGDALATVELLKILKNQGELSVIKKQRLALPENLSQREIDKIPETPGVYYFYAQSGELLYIGKSKNLAKRVRTHFKPDLKRKKDIELKAQVSRIEFKQLPNELLALLIECKEIKEKRPLYNRALKRRRFTYGVDLRRNEDGFLELYSRSVVNLDEDLYVYKSKKAAQGKIEAFYKSLFGPGIYILSDKIIQYQKTLGLEGYNKFVEKLFYQKIPKQQEGSLNILNSKGSGMTLYVENLFPKQYAILERGEVIEEGEFFKDPDLRSIVISHAHKKNLRLQN